MSNFKKYLNQVINEKLALVVRDAICNAIMQCYSDAIAKGNASMEIILARGEYNSLAERLDNMI